jgi:hypothetical protein
VEDSTKKNTDINVMGKKNIIICSFGLFMGFTFSAPCKHPGSCIINNNKKIEDKEASFLTIIERFFCMI